MEINTVLNAPSPNSLGDVLSRYLNVESPNSICESPIPESTLPEESYLTLVENVQVLPDISNINIEIVEQPSSNNHRFRYQSEQTGKQNGGKAIGALFGKNNTTSNKIYPTIKVTGYEGPATIIASCVEEKDPFRAHPNNLIGTNCKKGICIVNVNPETQMTAVFEKNRDRMR